MPVSVKHQDLSGLQKCNKSLWMILILTCLDCDKRISHETFSHANFQRTGRSIHPCGIAVCFNTLRPRQNGRHFTDDTFKCIFLNENVEILIKISLKFVHKGPINNIPALVQIMAWRRPGNKPLSEAMVVRLAMHICVTQPQ